MGTCCWADFQGLTHNYPVGQLKTFFSGVMAFPYSLNVVLLCERFCGGRWTWLAKMGSVTPTRIVGKHNHGNRFYFENEIW